MLKISLLSLLFIAPPAQAMELTWDDRKTGTGLRVAASASVGCIFREAQIEDIPFYHTLYNVPDIIKTLRDGDELTSEQIVDRVETWVERFANGTPFGAMTIEQERKAVGLVHLNKMAQRPGVGEVSRALMPKLQGKGLGTAALGFLVDEWAPAIRRIGLGQETSTPLAAVDKFKCFEGEPLKVIYAMTKISNPASWQCYKHFNFYPSEPTDKTVQISCENWESTQHGSLEDYIVGKYFSSTSSTQLLADVFYDMDDEERRKRTVSFVEGNKSLRYHFEHEVILDNK